MKWHWPLLTLAFATQAFGSELTDAATAKFRAALTDIDRITLVRTFEVPGAPAQPATLPELTGAETIRSLADTVEIQSFDIECRCLSSPAIQFRHGSDYRFSFTLHHGMRLRCEDGPWGGDAVLTDASAARFREWFAAHGYDGFVREWEMIQRLRREREAATKQVLSHFPTSVQALLTAEETFDREKDERNGAVIAAAFANSRDLALACWRGWGEVSTWDRSSARPYQARFAAALKHVPTADIRAALSALPDDKAVWHGAYLYASQKGNGEDRSLVDDETFARLAERSFRDTRGYEHRWVVYDLDKRACAPCDCLLLRIGAGEIVGPEADNATDGPTAESSTAALALVKLAARHIPEARGLILARQSNQRSTTERLVLDVALAYYDGPATLGLAHLNCEDVADEAWKLISSAPDFRPTTDFLVQVANSRSYAASQSADKQLRQRRLKRLTPLEQADEQLQNAPYASANTIETLTTEIDRMSSTSTFKRPEIESLILNRLFQRRGELRLARGDFEGALKDMDKAGQVPGALQRLAFIEQTLGKYSDATLHSRMASHESDQNSVGYGLAARGYRLFAVGQFEDAAEAFGASRLVRFAPRDLGSIMRHLAKALSGSPEPLPAEDPAEPLPGLRIADEALVWPDTAWRVIAGRMTEERLVAQIEESHHPDKDKSRCQAEFVLSVLGRIRGDTQSERRHLDAVIATQCFTEQTYSLARIRDRELKSPPSAP